MEENIFPPSNDSSEDGGDINEGNGSAFSEECEDSKFDDGKLESCSAYCSSSTGHDIQVTQQIDGPLIKNSEQSDISACFPDRPVPHSSKHILDQADIHAHPNYDLSTPKPQSDRRNCSPNKTDIVEVFPISNKMEVFERPVGPIHDERSDGQIQAEFSAESPKAFVAPETEAEPDDDFPIPASEEENYSHYDPKAFTEDSQVMAEEDLPIRIQQQPKDKALFQKKLLDRFLLKSQLKWGKTEIFVDVKKEVPLTIPTKRLSGTDPFFDGVVTGMPDVKNKATRDSVEASSDRDEQEEQAQPAVIPPAVVQNNGSACLTPNQSPNQPTSDVHQDSFDPGVSSNRQRDRTFDTDMGDDSPPRLLTTTQDRLQQDRLRLLTTLFAGSHATGRAPLNVVPPRRRRYGIREAQRGSPSHWHEERCLRCREILSAEEADDDQRHRCRAFVCAMCRHLRDNTRWRWTCPRCNAPICLLCNWEDHQCPEPCACYRGRHCRGQPP